MAGITNLVFEGGGVKIPAYVGALRVLEEMGHLKNIVKMAGTSAGAIAALLVGIGYSLDELEQLLRQIDFSKFKDKKLFETFTGNLIGHYGFYRGEFFYTWIQQRIQEKLGKPNATFADLDLKIAAQLNDPEITLKAHKFRKVYFVGVNLNTRFIETFSFEKTPQMPLADAVRISMSIPFFFMPFQNKTTGHFYVDGGVQYNYPIHLFDEDHLPNLETLGIRLDNADEIALLRDHKPVITNKIDNITDYISSVLSALLNAENRSHYIGGDQLRSIYIDCTGVQTTEFNLSKAKVDQLMIKGREATEAFFKNYENKWRQQHPIYKTAEKLKRLQKYDRKKLFQKSKNIFFPEEAQQPSVKIQWQFGASDNPLQQRQKMRKYFDQLKQQDPIEVVEWAETAEDPEHKQSVLMAIGDPTLITEAKRWQQKYGCTRSPAFSENQLIRVSFWQRQDELLDDQDTKLLFEAASKNNLEVVRKLIQKRVSMHHCDEQGNSALHAAARQNYDQVISALVQSRLIALDARNHYGDTPVHIAARFGKQRSLNALLSQGASANATNKFGNSPIFLVLLGDMPDEEKIACIQILVNFGADLQLRNDKNQTIIEFAEDVTQITVSDEIKAALSAHSVNAPG